MLSCPQLLEVGVVDGDGDSLLQVLHLFLGEVGLDLGFDFDFDVIEALVELLLNLDDVVSEGGFDGVADLTGGSGEGDFLKLRDHLAAAEGSKVSAIGS